MSVTNEHNNESSLRLRPADDDAYAKSKIRTINSLVTIILLASLQFEPSTLNRAFNKVFEGLGNYLKGFDTVKHAQVIIALATIALPVILHSSRPPHSHGHRYVRLLSRKIQGILRR